MKRKREDEEAEAKAVGESEGDKNQKLAVSRSYMIMTRLQNSESNMVQYSISQAPTSASISNANPPKASLLGLPGELRNNIYRWIFSSEGEEMPAEIEGRTGRFVVVTETYGLPGILHCCRQVRQEAESIYYQELCFGHCIHNYNLTPQPSHWLWNKVFPRRRGYLSFSGSGSWSNLLKRLRVYHEGVLPTAMAIAVRDEAEIGQEALLCARAFEIVQTMRHAEWRLVYQVLVSFRESLFTATKLPVFDASA